ncbi:MAG: hypothetical protein ACM31L_20390 [Actinomycetota bacterium]
MEAQVTLGSSTRDNLLSLKNAKALADTSAKRISSGLRVGSASDDAVSYYQAGALSARAADFLALKDGVDQGIQTLEAMQQGSSTVEQMIKQLKGLVLSAAGKGGNELAAVASQFDQMRQQITHVATDTIYGGSQLLANGPSLSVAVSPPPNERNRIDIPSRDLRVSATGQVDDIKLAWMDDSDLNGVNRVGTRTFSTALQPSTSESFGAQDPSVQGSLTIAELTGGNTVVGWDNAFNAGTIQVKDSSGAVTSTISLTGVESGLRLTALTGGRFAATWRDATTNDIRYAVYESDGAEVAKPADVVSAPLYTNVFPAITATADGGFNVTWSSTAASGTAQRDVFTRSYDSAGVAKGAPAQVNDPAGNDSDQSSVSGLTGGGAIAAWYDATTQGIMAKPIAADGTLGTQVRLDAGTAVACDNPRVAGLADGGFAAVWDASDGAQIDVIGRIFNADGSPRTNEFPINPATAGDSEHTYGIVALRSGGFAVTYTNTDAGGRSDCLIASFGKSGSLAAGPTVISQTTTNDQIKPAIASGSLYDLMQVNGGDEGGLHVRTAAAYGNFATADSRVAAMRDIDNALAEAQRTTQQFALNTALLKVRLAFNQNLSSTLTGGADKLTLIDLNEESANLLAMQVRTQMATQALTFSGQSDQSILQLFR